MKYAVVTSVLLASSTFVCAEVVHAQQTPPLPPVTVDPAKPQTGQQQGHQSARQNGAPKKKKRSANRSNQPATPAAAPAQAGAGGVHNAATNPNYDVRTVSVGPLGNHDVLDTPFSITSVPQDMMENLQLKTVNDTLRYLPSVEIRNQQGFEVSRPQSRGFQGTVVQNTRMDGLSVIGTTAIPAENLAGIQVLNGLAGSLYGPATPAGVFNYVLKRPTDTPYASYTQGYDSTSVFTENIDVGGRTPDGKVGYRFNVVHGEGESWAPESSTNRTLASGALDFYLGNRTVVETNFSHYETNITGLPGSITYFSKTNILLPAAVDPTRLGLGQPGAGTDLITNTGLVKLKHEFNNDWNFEIGGLYQDAVRNLLGITNSMTDNNGDYTVTKNFTAVPHFTIASNTASLNGKFDLFGFRNEVTIGTNGFFNGQYSYVNSIAVNNYGASNLADPTVFANPPTPNNGGQFKSAILQNQTIITGDTFHFNDQWAVQSVLSTSFLHSQTWNSAGVVTSQQSADGVVSPTVSLIYKPFDKVTAYATWANSVEQSDQAPTSTPGVSTVTNSGQFLSPYNDQEYEVGVKYAVTPSLLATFALFHMTRPFASSVVSPTNSTVSTFEVVGTQRNNGAELFLQGAIYQDLSVFGGVSYIDARLENTGLATTNGRLVVGVPLFKTDVALDYHPASWLGFALTGGVHAEGERAATNFNNSFAPSYATFDAGIRFSKTVDKHVITTRFQVLNIGNTFYYSSIADGTIVGSPGANTAYLGTPRTYLLSLQMTL
jgi:iron complex outermembrane receptor protein